MSGASTRHSVDKPAEVAVFATEENRTGLMAMYDEGLRRWPVPVGEHDGRTGEGRDDPRPASSTSAAVPSSSHWAATPHPARSSVSPPSGDRPRGHPSA